MPAKHKVSVVVPAYNSEKMLGRCIKSLLGQKGAREIIVVDDGSTDRTAAIATSFGLKVLRHKTNLGIAAARNSGIKSVKGDVILFVDSDCEAMPDLVKTIVKNYGKGVDGVGGRGMETGNSAADKWRRLTGGQGYGEKRKAGVPFLFGLCSSYRRGALLEAGLFDERFRTNGEDVDMGLRLNALGKKLIYEPEARVRHNRTDSWASLARMVYRAYKWGYFAYFKNDGIFRTAEIFAPSVISNFFGGIGRCLSREPGLLPLPFVFAVSETFGFLSAIKSFYFGFGKIER